MSVRNFAALFRPKSVAVIGASAQDRTPGALVMRNLLAGGFNGPIMPVAAKRAAIAGVLAYRDVESLPQTPDLAVICSPWDQVEADIEALARLGTHAAIVCARAPEGQADGFRADDLAALAIRHDMRILGPNSLGLMVPSVGLDASTAHQPALAGRLAFVSQSGAVCSAVLDWAKPKGIGFSHFVSLGPADIDFADLLDYLGSDAQTRAILLYIESIKNGRAFMSAARAAARNKPVLAIKAGRVAESARAAASHTGSLAGTDDVFDAALRRAGMLRVYHLEEMFAAVETLARTRPVRGSRLAMLTNGGGIGVMALDELVLTGGAPETLPDATAEALDRELPGLWSGDNPVDIGDDADAQRYGKAMGAMMAQPGQDALLVLHAPSAAAAPLAIAETVAAAAAAKAGKGNVLACWIGQDSAAPARRLLRESGVPTYDTPSAAVRGFMHLVDYRKNQDMLMEVPPSAPEHFVPDTAQARRIVDMALAGSGVLNEAEAKAVLRAYAIPAVETHIAATPAEAGRIVAAMTGPVALKILSPDIAHKSEWGGVMLNLQGPAEVETAARMMQESIRARLPDIRLDGFTVQPMARAPGAQELIVGVSTDPIFGPVIMFGQGGVAVEIIEDFAFALPPLNMSLARELIGRTRVFRLLEGYRGFAPADLDAICLALIKVSQMIVDIPEIVELDINPLFAGEEGVLALDAAIRVLPQPDIPAAGDRLAIRPYPKALEEVMTLADGRTCLLRPIRPEDEPQHHVFVSRLTPEDIRFRFFGRVGELPHSEMARLTQIDYDREMAFIATLGEGPEHETVGVVRAVADPDNEQAEFAVVVRSDLKRSGLGRKMMQKMIDYCRSRGTSAIVGQVLSDNIRMLKFIDGLGFKRVKFVDGDTVEVRLDLFPETVGTKN